MPRPLSRRTRRTKPEVKDEFDKIQAQAVQARNDGIPKDAELARIKEDEVRHSVEGTTVEGIVKKLSDLRLQISQELADISEKLVAEVRELATFREAVALEAAELERLHKIDMAATALDQMVEEYRAQGERLETQMATRRSEWAEEEKRRARELKEAEETVKRQRQRENEDYEYTLALERKKDQDDHEQEARQRDRKAKEKQEALEKSWAEREAALRERESEVETLRKDVAEHPARLKKEVDRASAEATKAGEQRFEQQLALLRKDTEGEKRVADLQIKALQETVARQVTHIEVLSRQLDEAKRQVQEIAVKAIEGASGAKALAHVNQIAMEQAKPRSTPA